MISTTAETIANTKRIILNKLKKDLTNLLPTVSDPFLAILFTPYSSLFSSTWSSFEIPYLEVLYLEYKKSKSASEASNNLWLTKFLFKSCLLNFEFLFSKS
ncbi:Uncharacterised protein [Chlamydia trachomatis]|nr:Uncharacterised protein [Chlamydia trachomatis]